MKIEYIANQVRETVKKYDETDPVRLAKAMNIYLRFDHLGTAPGCIKGFFACIDINLRHFSNDLINRSDLFSISLGKIRFSNT